MTSFEPLVIKTGRYSVKETCEILQIHRNSLTAYTENGLIKCGIRKTNGRKYYVGSDIKKFWESSY